MSPLRLSHTAPALLLILSLITASKAAETPILRIEPGGHTARVQQVVFTPDGTQLISVGWDKAIRIWSIKEGWQTRTLRCPIGLGDSGRLFASAISPNLDAPLLAVGGYDQPQPKESDIRLFDLNSGQMKPWLLAHKGPITSLAFSRSGALLVSGSEDHRVRLWNPENGALLQTFDHKTPVSDVLFSPDEKLVASCGLDGTVRIWDLQTHRDRLLNCSGRVAAWSPDGALLATGSEDGRIHLCNPITGAETNQLEQREGVTCLAWSPDGRWLISGSGEGEGRRDTRVHRWSMPEGKPEEPFTRHPVTVLAAAFSPDSHLAASADGYGDIYLWDPATGVLKKSLPGLGSSPSMIAWSPDSKRLAWETATTNETAVLAGSAAHIFDLDQGMMGPDVADTDNWRRGSNAQTGKKLELSDEHWPSVAIRAGDRRLKLLKLADPQDKVHSFTFTNDGAGVIIGSDFALSLYETEGSNERPVLSFVGHDGIVRDLAVSPDGRFLASASVDGTVRIWRLSLKRSDQARKEVEPLLSIFRAQNAQWTAWAPAGYYNASPFGDKLIGWQVNRGPNQAADFYQAYQFRHLFYRPDVIHRLLKAGDVAEALRLADAERGPATQTPAPTISILSPEPGKTVTGETIQISAHITDPDGGKKFTVMPIVNGQQGRGIELAAKGIELAAKGVELAPKNVGVGEWTGQVQLGEGLNKIELVAINEKGVQSQPASLQVIREENEHKPALYMIAVGVTLYQDTRFNTLHFPAKDAGDVKNMWQAQGEKLFSKVEPVLLTDTGANKEDILKTLDELQGKVQGGDWTVVFMSGHGYSHEDANKDRKYYYAPYNFDPDHCNETGIQWDEVASRLTRLPGHTMIILDACHGLVAGSTAYNDLLRASSESGLITFASCLPNENSNESLEEPYQNGIFTHYLLEALTPPRIGVESADLNGDGIITLAEADAYISNHVKDATNGIQHPSVDHSTYTPSTLELASVH